MALFSTLMVFCNGSAAAPQVIVSFNGATLETPESVAFDYFGNAYVSLALTGEIRKIAPDLTQSTLAVLPIGVSPPGTPLPGALGPLAVRADGTVFASLPSADQTQKGVWKIKPDGVAEILAHLPAGSFPNGIALYWGQLYVADSFLGVIWRVSQTTGERQIWVNDPDLLPDPTAPFPGANGLKIFNGEVYVSNSGRGTIVAYPINCNGSAGPKRVHATGLFGDDFGFDLLGNLYIATDPFNTLVKVSPNGTQQVLATVADGLDGPTAVAFGVTLNTLSSLYITNAAFPFFPTTHQPNPSLMKLDLSIPGAPLWPF